MKFAEKYCLWFWAAIVVLTIFVLPFVDGERVRKARTEECRVLAAIGVKAGDNITIYGDIPTWKIACLMGDGDN